MKKIYISLLATLLLTSAIPASAQELVQDQQEIAKARVTEVINEKKENIGGTETPHLVQKIRVEMLEGEKKGLELVLDNDVVSVVKGDTIYVKRLISWDGSPDIYSVYDVYRLPYLTLLALFFIAITIAFGGKQGARGLLSLAGSLAFIFFMLMPGIANGFSPVWTSIAVASLIIVLGSYVTHGFNRTTTSAVIGMITTIFIVGIIAHFSINGARLTGFESDETLYLNFAFNGTLDLAGVLLGGMLIGLLGVMYDAAIGQAISVEELHRAAPHLSRRFIYSRGVRIGREHIGALVNTLAIAYVGASLPLLLLFYTSTSESISVILNRELFAVEIVRSIVGSIGIILAVPVTTAIAVFMLHGRLPKHISEHGHSHGHIHGLE
jgi:uncharacterized membrane protein